MNRRQIIKGLFSGLALLFTPKVVASKEKTYAFKELFTNRVFKNNNMFFLKKSVFKEHLYKDVAHLIQTSGRYFYNGEHDVILPVKPIYTEKELTEFFIIVRHRILKYGMLLQQGKGQPIYFMRNPSYGRGEKHLILNMICDFKREN